jgi:hypothetical protein
MNNKTLRDELKKSKASMDSLFASRLENQLHARAQEILQPQKGSSLFVNKKFMRFSFATLVLIATVLSVSNPFGAINADEVIQRANAAYETTESGKIYHEKIHFKYPEDEGGGIVETWMDGSEESGNFLRIESDFLESEGINNIFMRTVDENGNEKFFSETYDAFSVPHYVCVMSDEDEFSYFKNVLEVANDDLNNYAVYNTSKNKAEDPEIQYGPEISTEPSPESFNKLEEAKLNKDRAAEILQELMNTENLEFDNETFNGTEYYTFSLPLYFNTDDEVKYYFNADTYKLEIEERYPIEDPELKDVTTYLVSEYLDVESDSIFNAEKYELYEINFQDINFELEDACYKPDNTKMSDEEEKLFLSTLSEDAIYDFNKFGSSYESDLNSGDPFSYIDIELAYGLIMPFKEWQITAGFGEDHPGMDIVSKDSSEILAAQSGEVVKVSRNAWNGGYGNSVTIDHGNGLSTLYSHCSDIYVSEGDEVKQGQAIAKVGNSGRTYGNTGILLHWELIKDGTKVNPIK